MTTTGPRRGKRNDYTPGVRPRTARQDGARRLTPGYLDDLSDTKTAQATLTTVSTRETVLTPTKGRKIRLIQLTLKQHNGSDGLHWAEVYWGTGAVIADGTAIDIVRVPDQGEGSTRTWARGAGPVSAKDEVLSVRFTVAPSTIIAAIIEYTEER